VKFYCSCYITPWLRTQIEEARIGNGKHLYVPTPHRTVGTKNRVSTLTSLGFASEFAM
jgi:hypothetical protein